MPRKSGSLLIVIVNEIYFIPHEQSFSTKEFSQGFSDFLYALSFNNKNPSSMTIITVTQGFSDWKRLSKPASIICFFIVTCITHTIQ